MKLSEIILVSIDKRVDVFVDTKYETVLITDHDDVQDEILLQGDDARVFINDAESLWDKAGDISICQAWLYKASRMAECLWD